VPGAQHVSVSDDGKLSGAALPADKAATVAFYCGSERCDASDEAAEVAVGQGYASVVVYKGGIAGWEKAGKPVEVPAAKPAAATPAVNTPAAKPAKGEG
jgi:rhodanese-related sulfurtransferase